MIGGRYVKGVDTGRHASWNVNRKGSLKRTCGIRLSETLKSSFTPNGQLYTVWNSEVVEKKTNDRM